MEKDVKERLVDCANAIKDLKDNYVTKEELEVRLNGKYFRIMTQAQYDALQEKEANITYIIEEDK